MNFRAYLGISEVADQESSLNFPESRVSRASRQAPPRSSFRFGIPAENGKKILLPSPPLPSREILATHLACRPTGCAVLIQNQNLLPQSKIQRSKYVIRGLASILAELSPATRHERKTGPRLFQLCDPLRNRKLVGHPRTLG